MSKRLAFNQTYEEMKEDLTGLFDTFIEDGKEEFINYASAYFSYMVLTEGANGVTDSPVNLSDYTTVEELLKANHMFPVLADGGTITWLYQFEAGVEEFITAKFHELFLDGVGGREPIYHAYLDESDWTNEEAIASLLDKFIHLMGGEAYFVEKSKYLQSFVLSGNPKIVYKRGEDEAKKSVGDITALTGSSEAEYSDLMESVIRLNALMDKLGTRYLHAFDEPLPKGKIDKDTYREKFSLMLQSLQLENVPVDEIRELALLDTRFVPAVLLEIANFEYIY